MCMCPKAINNYSLEINLNQHFLASLFSTWCQFTNGCSLSNEEHRKEDIIISHSFSNKYSSKYILYYCTLLIDKVGYFGDVVGVSYG